MKNNEYLIRLEDEMKRREYSQNYIDLVKSYALRLISNSVTVIFDFNHLCYLLDIPQEKLRSFMDNEYLNYRSFEIPKKSGSMRSIEAPIESLKTIQRWILDNILCNVSISDHTFGFRKEKSILDNAIIHKGQECVINVDIVDFFNAIKGAEVYKIYRYLGYTKQVSSILTMLSIKDDSLPQGAPTSPYLSNISCKKMDKRLSKLAQSIGANYSRYADDITLSGSIHIKNYLGTIKKIIENEGFQINKKKYEYNFKIKDK